MTNLQASLFVLALAVLVPAVMFGSLYTLKALLSEAHWDKVHGILDIASWILLVIGWILTGISLVFG